MRDYVQQNCPMINYTPAYFCGDPPSELQNFPTFQYFSYFFSNCLSRSCQDNSSCVITPSPPTPPAPEPLPPLCYDCCVACFSGNETACQNSPPYGLYFRRVNDPQTGCLSCTPAPPQSTPPPPQAPTCASSASSFGGWLVLGLVALGLVL